MVTTCMLSLYLPITVIIFNEMESTNQFNPTNQTKLNFFSFDWWGLIDCWRNGMARSLRRKTITFFIHFSNSFFFELLNEEKVCLFSFGLPPRVSALVLRLFVFSSPPPHQLTSFRWLLSAKTNCASFFIFCFICFINLISSINFNKYRSCSTQSNPIPQI